MPKTEMEALTSLQTPDSCRQATALYPVFPTWELRKECLWQLVFPILTSVDLCASIFLLTTSYSKSPLYLTPTLGSEGGSQVLENINV